MRTIFIISVVASILLSSCNNSKITYKFQENQDLFPCENYDSKLVKEAVYAFEQFIENNYTINDSKNLINSYARYWAIASTKQLPKVHLLDEHLKEIILTLKEEEYLWTVHNGEYALNLDNTLGQCLINNIKNEDINKSLSLLVEYKTYKKEYVLPIFKRDVSQLIEDRALATYVALEFFYSKLMNQDLNITEEQVTNHNREVLLNRNQQH